MCGANQRAEKLCVFIRILLVNGLNHVLLKHCEQAKGSMWKALTAHKGTKRWPWPSHVRAKQGQLRVLESVSHKLQQLLQNELQHIRVEPRSPVTKSVCFQIPQALFFLKDRRTDWLLKQMCSLRNQMMMLSQCLKLKVWCASRSDAHDSSIHEPSIS